jgi:hypothetical protein
MDAPTGERALPERERPEQERREQARPERERREWDYPDTILPARLALRPPTFPPGPLTGAWWPRSDDLTAELPALIDAFDTSWGRVTRIAAHRDTWAQAPCALPVNGHTVKAAWLESGFDAHTIRLFAYGVGRRDLLVVPPGTGAAAAARLMSAAADPALRLTAGALITAEERRAV